MSKYCAIRATLRSDYITVSVTNLLQSFWRNFFIVSKISCVWTWTARKSQFFCFHCRSWLISYIFRTISTKKILKIHLQFFFALWLFVHWQNVKRGDGASTAPLVVKHPNSICLLSNALLGTFVLVRITHCFQLEEKCLYQTGPHMKIRKNIWFISIYSIQWMKTSKMFKKMHIKNE